MKKYFRYQNRFDECRHQKNLSEPLNYSVNKKNRKLDVSFDSFDILSVFICTIKFGHSEEATKIWPIFNF